MAFSLCSNLPLSSTCLGTHDLLSQAVTPCSKGPALLHPVRVSLQCGSRVGRGAAGCFFVAAGSLEHEPAWSQGWEPKPPPPCIRPVVLFPPLGLDTMNYGFAVGLVVFVFFLHVVIGREFCAMSGGASASTPRGGQSHSGGSFRWLPEQDATSTPS